MSALSILLIDDDPLALELIEVLLKQVLKNANVCALADASQAIVRCRERHFDCVLVDYNMPGENGLAVAQALRAAHPYMPIILCTGAGDESLAAHALKTGVNDYIPKPKMSADVLARAIKTTIRDAQQSRIIDEQRKEIEDFAYALSHDFKQPVRQLMVFASLISDGIQEGRTSELPEQLRFLHNAASRLDALVDVMSQYTLLNKAPELGDVDLNAVVDGVRSSLGHYLQETKGRVVDSPAPIVRSNEALMGQVLQNLIVNGLKYNKSAAPTVWITHRVVKDACLIQVRDNGIGIEKDYLEEVFKPLKRLHTSDQYSGSGLGLTLARKAVLAQGGAIWCDSEAGAGATFSIKIPLAKRKAA